MEAETSALGDAISAGTKVAQQSAPLSEADSQTVAVAVLGLEPQIFSLLTNTESRKEAFDTAALGVGSVSPTVEQSLKEQAQLSAALGNAIAAKVTSDFAGPAGIINSDIAAAFSTAIQDYAVPGGLFALPPVPDLSGFL